MVQSLQLKGNLSSCTKWQANLKFTFINAIVVSLFLLQLSFTCNPAFFFQHRKKAIKIYMSFSWTCFCYYKRHSNNNNICLLPSSACFQQRFHDRFSVLWYNSDEQHYYLTPTESVICHIYANVSPFQLLSLVPFHIRLPFYTENWSVTF